MYILSQIQTNWVWLYHVVLQSDLWAAYDPLICITKLGFLWIHANYITYACQVFYRVHIIIGAYHIHGGCIGCFTSWQFLPLQSSPFSSNSKPSLQLQVNDPTVSVHIWSQGSSSVHSSMSTKIENQTNNSAVIHISTSNWNKLK